MVIKLLHLRKCRTDKRTETIPVSLFSPRKEWRQKNLENSLPVRSRKLAELTSPINVVNSSTCCCRHGNRLCSSAILIWNAKSLAFYYEVTSTDNCSGEQRLPDSLFSAAEIWSPGRQMRPTNRPGDPRSHHRWSIWWPMNSLGFAENNSEWNWT